MVAAAKSAGRPKSDITVASKRDKPTAKHLQLWRTLRFHQLWKALTEAGAQAQKGTPQKKMRWRRAEQLAQRKRNKAVRRRVRTAITKKVQRSRRLKGQNARTGN